MAIQQALRMLIALVGRIGLLLLLPTLALLEPVVRYICCFLMFGGILVAVLFESSAVGPRFPFLVIFGISLAFGATALLYQMLLEMLVRVERS